MKKPLVIATAAMAVTPITDAHAGYRAGDLIRLADLRVNQAVAAPGQSVAVELSLVNESSRKLEGVKWSVVVGKVRKSGELTLTKGQEKTVKVTLTAPSQTTALHATVAPPEGNAEPSYARSDNRIDAKLVVASQLDRNTLRRIAAAVDAVERELDAEGRYLRVKKATIKGSTATLDEIASARPSKVPSLSKRIAATLAKQGNKEDSQAYGRAAEQAWERWVEGYKGVLENAFPEFAAYPGKVTPETEARPVVVGGSASAFSAALVEKDARDHGVDPKLAEVYGQALQARFEVFTLTARWVGLKAKGTVPTFAPPYVPVGPVFGGDNIAVPGHLVR